MTIAGGTAQFKLFHLCSHGFCRDGETETLSRNSLGRERHFHRTDPDQRAGKIMLLAVIALIGGVAQPRRLGRRGIARHQIGDRHDLA